MRRACEKARGYGIAWERLGAFVACRWDRVELLPTISDVRNLVVSWGSLFFFFKVQSRVFGFGVVGCESFQ